MKSIGELLANRVAARRAELGPAFDEPEAEAPGCRRCGGAKFIYRRRPIDDPLFGRAEPCGCVLTEASDTRLDRLQRLSNLGTLARFTFETLDPSRAAAAVVKAAEAFASAPEGWLAISGSGGSGKTHLAAAIANRAIREGHPALVWVVPDLLDSLRSGYDATESELDYDQLFDQVKNHPLLVLDDIDAIHGTPWAREKLFQIVNHRWNAELATVFTSTAAPTALDERLGAKLTAGHVQHLSLDAGRPAGYHEVGGMTRDRLVEMQFGDLAHSRAWTQQERDSFAAAVASCRDWSEEPGGWLVLSGAHGCGKTHMAAAIAARALRNGMSVFFAVVPDLLDHLRASFAPDATTVYDDLFEQVRNVDLLVLDDLGAHKSSPWAEEKLYQIVNYRGVSRLPAVITTDLKPDGLAQVHPRIYARVMDPHFGKFVDILSPHYALGRAPERAAAPARKTSRRGGGREDLW